MKYLLKLFLNLCVLTLVTRAAAQPFPIGNWREHMSYLQGRSLALSPSRVYCATQDGLFAYQPADQSITRYSKLNNLNDFGVKTIAYQATQKLLVVVYNNTNIDLVTDNGEVINLSDIKRKNIPGNKTVNKVTFEGNFAYLSCGFGIVVVDLVRREVKDTYYISASASDADVNDVALDGTWIYAAANDGIYRASITDPFISNFTAWTKIMSDTGSRGDFKLAEFFNNAVYFTYSLSSGDSMLSWNGSWGTSLPAEMAGNGRKRSLTASGGKLFMTEPFGLSVFDVALQRIIYVDANQIPAPDFTDGIQSADGTVWITDLTRGLLKVNGNAYEKIQPSGPNSYLCAAMQVVNDKLWVIHGPRTKGWNNVYRYDGFSSFKGATWNSWDGYAAASPFFSQLVFYDNMSMAIDPSNENHLFIGSGGGGLLEFLNGQAIKLYRDTNSTLLQQFGNPGQVKVHGLVLDNDRNLWVSNAGVNSVINVLKPDGTWRRFTFPGKINSSAKTGDMIMDDNGYLWNVIFENSGGKDGILVFNPNGTPDITSDDQFDVVDFGSSRVRCLTKDKDGTIWVGTETGLYLFYPPSIVPQRILIRQDNQFQYLLSGEVVTAIAVDGANRKWIGTESGGLYLFSADGQTKLLQFTSDNSPLFSNNINSLAIQNSTGEVFVGTDKGLMSYQGDAIEGPADVTGCKDVVVYPNPVESGYDGPIAIKGVVPNGLVKITDVSGGLVFQTTALGTQAIWNGKNLQGEDVSTGVYLVLSSDATGENSCVSKIMFFR